MDDPSEHLDLDTLMELREVMEDEFDILIDTFLNDSKVRLAAIRSAVDTGNAEELRTSAHSFKGSSSNIGAPKLAESCKVMEDMGRENQLTNAASALQRVEQEYQAVRQALQHI